MKAIYYMIHVGTFTTIDGIAMCAVFVTMKNAGSLRDPIPVCRFVGTLDAVSDWAAGFVAGFHNAVCCNGAPCTEKFMLAELKTAFRHARRMRGQAANVLDLYEHPVKPAHLFQCNMLNGELSPLELPMAA